MALRAYTQKWHFSGYGADGAQAEENLAAPFAGHPSLCIKDILRNSLFPTDSLRNTLRLPSKSFTAALMGMVVSTIAAAGTAWWSHGGALAMLSALACLWGVCSLVLWRALVAQLALLASREQEFHDRQQALEADIQRKDTLFKVAAHDVRSPLSCVLSLAEMRREQCEGGRARMQDLCKTLAQIERSAQDIEHILEGLLEVQREGPSSSASCELHETLASAVARFRPQCERKRLLMVLDMGEEKLTTRADAVYVQRALDNYLSNAVKFSPWGGQIVARARRNGNWVTISVRDEGRGVPAWERTTLFTEWSRTSTQPTGGESSLGLGLALVKRLIEGQGGRVGAEFPSEGGAIFWMRLPAPARQSNMPELARNVPALSPEAAFQIQVP